MNKKLTRENLFNIKLAIFDFDGVFTDNKVLVSQNGVESVLCCRSDGIGLSRIHSIGIKSYVISSETNPVVKVRCEKLKIRLIQGVLNKKKVIEDLCQSINISPRDCLFLGNDINDICAFQIVGCPVAVADSYEEINDYVIYKTIKKGGEGAVREICDLLFHYKNVI